ncbi:peptide/nickel transport system substrate-binding protein [Raineyella antarctica]|uniref:Peptide/nickel transport system substrate-binding protein n=1 Tax=Raineyella antarctica TaxID=1577474 RepID=A0A1G6GV78_9ACTN|nr:ABC transporter substrate-binding protein [Raineyella antarctica]SDB85841.1 peptide/nickel transport system substrate-binding protein [Raineyella antarctica]
MRRRLGFVVAWVTGLALVLAGCSGQAKDTSGGHVPANSLVIGATAEPPTLDPTKNNAAAIPQVLLYNVYETLVRVDSSGNLHGLLAQEWQVSPDRRTYTFRLDPAATFASGRRLTATDVKWSFDRIKSPDTSSVLRTQMAVVQDVQAKDPSTLVVSLKRPSNSWLWNMSSTAGIVIDSQAAGDLAATPAGSGPYLVNEWTKGSQVVLARNPKYWATPPRVENVTFRYFSDATAMNSAMLSGDLNVISNVQAPQALDRFSDPEKYTVLQGTTNGEVVLGMNNRNKALSDPRVRQALTYAIDRKALLDSVWAGKGTLIGSMVPPTDPWYEDLSGAYPYDPAKAKQLLKEAGYESGLTLRMRLPTLAYAKGAGQFIQSQLAAVGVTVVIDELEFPARWIDVVMRQSDYDLTIVAHVEPRDMVNFADPEYYWHYDSAEFRRLMAAADAGTPQEYIDDQRVAARVLSRDAAADWLFLLPNLVVTTPNVSGINANATSLSFDVTKASVGS